MTRWLLDTNAVIDVLDDPHSRTAKRMRRRAESDIAISSIVVHELFYGAFKSQRRDRNLAIVDGLRFQVLDFDGSDARHAGEIRATLAQAGKTIGPYDILIAGQARARCLTLVTHNTAEFSRVPGLDVVDWR